KYPLACLDYLMSVYGEGLAVGYNIGCNHSGTVARSQLSAKAKSLNLQFYVGTFHGYALSGHQLIAW
ncbi:hypothetical protein DACRYDRAFT_42924, partial [Dacryopinax primogenitus]